MASSSPSPNAMMLIKYAGITKWRTLGVLLGLDSVSLDAIDKANKDEGEKLLQMYERWIATNPNATYNDVIEALESTPLQEMTVANKFKKHLQKGQMEQKRPSEGATIYKPNNLDTKDLVQVLKALRDNGFGTTNWMDLGLNLGLYINTLHTIEGNKHTLGDRLNECLSAWLKLQDDVKAKGGATWSSLVAALRDIGENAVADKIESDKV